MFDTVLVPLDGSDAADAAIPFARLLPAARYRLLRVEPDIEGVLGALAGIERDAWRRREEATAQEELERSAAALAGRPVEPIVVFADDPADAILDAATDADLVVMTTHGRGAVGRLLSGAVADRVARHAGVPVLLVRPGEAPVATPRIVVPLDGSTLAEDALTAAAALGVALGAPLHLIRVVDQDDVLRLLRVWRMAGQAIDDTGYDRARVACEEEARSYLADQATRLADQGLPVTTEVETGTPSFELLEAIEPGDIVVMSSHGRGGIRRWLIGSVADKLVRDGSAPVLLVPSAAAKAA